MKTTLTILALLAGSALATNSFAQSLPINPHQAPGFYRMMLGDWQVTAVSDGTVVVPLDKLLTRISPQKLQQRYGSGFDDPSGGNFNQHLCD